MSSCRATSPAITRKEALERFGVSVPPDAIGFYINEYYFRLID